jgi:hypothetical protein
MTNTIKLLNSATMKMPFSLFWVIGIAACANVAVVVCWMALRKAETKLNYTIQFVSNLILLTFCLQLLNMLKIERHTA